MLMSLAVQRIQRRLGFRKDLASSIIDELMDAQEKFERGVPVPIVASAYMGRFLAGGGSFLPWFLRTEVTTAFTTIGEERVPVPLDFIREWDEDALYWYNPSPYLTPPFPPVAYNQWKPLVKDDLSYNRVKYSWEWPQTPSPPGGPPWTPPAITLPGPKAYSLDGKYFRIFPTPNAVYQLKMIYYGHATPLDPNNDSENVWLANAPNVLIGEAGYNIAATARDNDRMQYFEKIRDEGLARAFVDTIGQDAEGRQFTMGRED